MAGSPYPRPLTAPPPWLSLLEPGQGEPPTSSGKGPMPGEGWPKFETVDYANKLIMLMILLLALPWLLGKLISDPEHMSRHAAKMATGA
jgi:hypothetical protein